MKFSDIEREKWDELSPYLDTCLLPVTGLTGKETPYEATEKLEELRDVLDLVEVPFKGRVVTYPACHYVADQEGAGGMIAHLVDQLRHSGFAYIIIATANSALRLEGAGADLILKPGDNGKLLERASVGDLVKGMWSAGSAS